jgi:hypothetical protein
MMTAAGAHRVFLERVEVRPAGPGPAAAVGRGAWSDWELPVRFARFDCFEWLGCD